MSRGKWRELPIRMNKDEKAATIDALEEQIWILEDRAKDLKSALEKIKRK